MTTNVYPKHPTNGWMISELERLKVRVRGTKLATEPEKMAQMLRERGYDVSISDS